MYPVLTVHGATTSSVRRGPGRVGALDAARGAALILVCVSHFAYAYLLQVGSPSAGLLMEVTMVASPAFMLISGMTLGYLYDSKADDRDALRAKLLDRSAFILLVVHPILALAERTRHGSMAAALQTTYITDTVALAMLIGPYVIAVTRPLARLMLAAACVALTWVLLGLGEPSHAGLRALGRMVVGSMTPDVTRFPLLPWLGLYLVGTVLGQCYVDTRTRSRGRGSEMLIAWGAGSAVLAALMRLAANVGNASATLDHPVLMVWQKHPPSPVYFLWFGGCALMLIGACGFLRRTGVIGYGASWLRSLGQASLFVFVVQDVVYFTGFYSHPLPYTALWPAVLALTILGIALAGRIWAAADANRLLTLGIPTLMRGFLVRRRAAAA